MCPEKRLPTTKSVVLVMAYHAILQNILDLRNGVSCESDRYPELPLLVLPVNYRHIHFATYNKTCFELITSDVFSLIEASSRSCHELLSVSGNLISTSKARYN